MVVQIILNKNLSKKITLALLVSIKRLFLFNVLSIVPTNHSTQLTSYKRFFSAHAKFDIVTGVCDLVETESVNYKSVTLLNRLLPQDLLGTEYAIFVFRIYI